MLYSAIIASPISTAVSRPYYSHLSQRRDRFKLSPWQGIRPYGLDDRENAYQHTSSHAARKEVFNAVQAAAAQSAEDTVVDMLQQFSNATEVVRREQSSLARVKPTALTAKIQAYNH